MFVILNKWKNLSAVCRKTSNIKVIFLLKRKQGDIGSLPWQDYEQIKKGVSKGQKYFYLYG